MNRTLMNRYKSIYTEVKQETFSLPPKLPSTNYLITNSLKDVETWKAKIYLANNGGKKGKMDNIGYIAFHNVSNIIIPIAHGDEHQQGYELLHHFYTKRTILNPPKEWTTISPVGTNYIYKPTEEREVYLNVIRRWIKWGGQPDLILKSSGNDGESKWSATFSEYLETNGKPPISRLGTKTLATRGRRLISLLEKLALNTNSFHSTLRIPKRFFEDALDVIELVSAGINSPWFPLAYAVKKDQWESFKNFPEQAKKNIMKAMPSENIDVVEQVLFSQDGLKNQIHMGLKYFVANYEKEMKEGRSVPDLEAFFGDLEFAVEELNRLGGI